MDVVQDDPQITTLMAKAGIGEITLVYTVSKTYPHIVFRDKLCSAGTVSVEECGTYNDPDVAHEVAYALCKSEHEKAGYIIGDERFQYPERTSPIEYREHVG